MEFKSRKDAFSSAVLSIQSTKPSLVRHSGTSAYLYYILYIYIGLLTGNKNNNRQSQDTSDDNSDYFDHDNDGSNNTGGNNWL